jgi:hypothetical protein
LRKVQAFLLDNNTLLVVALDRLAGGMCIRMQIRQNRLFALFYVTIVISRRSRQHRYRHIDHRTIAFPKVVLLLLGWGC